MDITDKVAKLLAQAENAGTEEEAATFTEKAQELAAIYSIDLARARHLNLVKERTTPVTKTITLGVKGTRGLNTLFALFRGIAEANDITLNVAHNSTYVVAFGFAEDIEVAEALFASLSVQMSQAVSEYKKRGDWQGDRAAAADDWLYGTPNARSVPWLTARLDFQAGYASRIAARLAQARREAEKVERGIDAHRENPDAGTDLVLVAKRDAVSDYYKQNSTARGSYRGHRQTKSAGAWRSGHTAGGNARIGSDTSLPGARREIAS